MHTWANSVKTIDCPAEQQFNIRKGLFLEGFLLLNSGILILKTLLFEVSQLDIVAERLKGEPMFITTSCFV